LLLLVSKNLPILQTLKKNFHFFFVLTEATKSSVSSMTTNSTWAFLTKKIREGYEKADVDMWQALCQQCKMDIGNSIEHMYVIIDMAKHNECDVLDIIKTGRVSSGQKAINEAFINSLLSCIPDDEEPVGVTKAGVLDLTAKSESGSYEETDEPPVEYYDNPTSNEAYEIDGFVVNEDECPHGIATSDACSKCSKKRRLKRKLPTIKEETEE